MSKTKISEFSTTPGNNTDINGINIAEGCAPSGINNAIRELMSDLKEWQSGAMDVYVIPQGTAAAPGIQLYGDLDTGLYGYAANQLGVAVGGASAGYFSSAGWNGNITGDINATTIDTTNLEVTNIKAKDGTAAIALTDSTGVVTLARTTSATNSVNEMLVLEHYSTGTISAGFGSGIKFFGENTGGGNSVYAAIHAVWEGGIGDPSGGALVFLTDGYVGDNTERVRITSEGKVGIGTATPSTTLEVAGSATVTGATTLSATTQNIALGTSQTTGTWTAGGASQTGALTLDQSTKTHTLNLGTGATESGLTKTVNIGTGGVSTSTTTITIGSANGTSTTLNGTVTAATFNSTTIDTTNIEVTNIKAKDGSASATIADSTGVMTIASSVLTTTDINGGTIDGTTIGGSTAAAGTFTTATATTGNITTVNATTVDTTNLEVTNIKAKDGTAALSIADSTGVVSVSANPVLSGGTANGVVYLNASKVATSGSALVFDGSTFGLVGSTGASGTVASFTTIDNPAAGRDFLRFVRQGVGTAGSIEYSEINSIGINSTTATIFKVNTSERMRLNSTSLNIGGNFTSTNNTLQVTGNAAIGYTTAAPTTGLIVAGNVGVGTDAPQGKLNVAGYTSANSDAEFQITRTSSNTGIGQAPGIRFNDGTTNNTRIIQNGSGNLQFWHYNGSWQTEMTLNSSGNLGLGVTPSAWTSGYSVLQTAGVGSFVGASQSLIGTNLYIAAGIQPKFIANGYAPAYNTIASTGQHVWYTTGNNVSGANQNASLNQAMTLDASGNLLVGSTSTSGLITGQLQLGTTSSSNAGIQFLNSTTGSGGLYFGDSTSGNARFRGYIEYSHNSDAMLFGTAETERARITSGGYFKASNDGTYYGSTGSQHELRNTANGEWVVRAVSASATDPNGMEIRYSAATPNGTANRFLYCLDSTALRAEIRSNGGLANYSANDVNLASDRRLKNTIEPMRSYYDVFKNINWVTWLYNDQTDDLKNHGVIAQELQELAPEFVCESNAKEAPEGEAPYLGIWEQDFKMAGMSVITELIKKIEKLEAEVAALKGV